MAPVAAAALLLGRTCSIFSYTTTAPHNLALSPSRPSTLTSSLRLLATRRPCVRWKPPSLLVLASLCLRAVRVTTETRPFSTARLARGLVGAYNDRPHGDSKVHHTQ